MTTHQHRTRTLQPSPQSLYVANLAAIAKVNPAAMRELQGKF